LPLHVANIERVKAQQRKAEVSYSGAPPFEAFAETFLAKLFSGENMNIVLKVISAINSKISKVVNISLIIMMSLMTLFIFAQVIFRYALKLPLSWSEELSRYLFTGITLFGAVILYRSNTHINMTLLKDAIKIKAVQAAMDIAAQVLTLVFLLIVIRYGFPLSARMLNLGGISPSMPWFKIG
jgi:TRAP-type C4-dicarboxylate transport system permease small subunit